MPVAEVRRHLGVVLVALDRLELEGEAARRLDRVRADVEHVSGQTVERAVRHLAEHQLGPSARTGGAGGGRSSGGDITGEAAAGAADGGLGDVVDREVRLLEERLRRLRLDSVRLLGAGVDADKVARRLEVDAREVRFTLVKWSRVPDTRWCTHCLKTNGHREPVPPGGRWRDVCAPCGRWRKVNGALPPRPVLEYLQRREPVPQRLLAQLRLKVPKVRA